MSFYTKIRPFTKIKQINLQKELSAKYFPPFIPCAEQSIDLLKDYEIMRRALLGKNTRAVAKARSLFKTRTLDDILKPMKYKIQTSPDKPLKYTIVYIKNGWPGGSIGYARSLPWPKKKKLVFTNAIIGNEKGKALYKDSDLAQRCRGVHKKFRVL